MATKRLKVTGYIEYPDGADLPELGQKVHGRFRGDVTADNTKRTKKADGDITIVETHVVTIEADESKVTKVEEAEEQPQLTGV